MSTHEQWIAAYLDGTLSENEQAALGAWLREAPGNMRVFVEHNYFEPQISQTVKSQAQREAAACFQETASEVPPPVSAKVPVRSRTTRVSHWFLRLSAAAAVILIGFFLWLRPQTRPARHPPRRRPRCRAHKPYSEVAGVISWILTTDFTDFTDFRMHQTGLGIIFTTFS